MKYLYKLAFILVFGAGMSLAQTGATGQNPPTTPPTFPSGQSGTQTPSPSTNPDQTSPMGQTGTTSTTAITKAQSDIQTALRKQLPASADSVTVSVSDENKIQLNGTVSSDTERQQIMDVAKAAAPDQKIEDKLKVSAAMPPSGGNPTSPGATPTQTTPPPDQTAPDKSRPQAQPPLTLVSFQAGTQDKSSNMGQNPSQGSSPQQNPDQGSSTQQPSSAQQPPSTTGNATSQAGAGSTDVQSNIQKALQQDSSLSSANINVNVTKDNKVELTGTVADKEQKKTAKKIAESNAAGYKVVDHLKVAGAGAKSSTPPPKY